MKHQFYEIELAKAEVEHKDPDVVGFFILQYANLRMLDFYYNFFDKFCDISKFEELEMDTDSLYFALAEQELIDCIRPEMEAQWENMRSIDCEDSFAAEASGNLTTRESRVSSKKNSSVRKCCVFVVKLIAATILPLTS